LIDKLYSLELRLKTVYYSLAAVSRLMTMMLTLLSLSQTLFSASSFNYCQQLSTIIIMTMIIIITLVYSTVGSWLQSCRRMYSLSYDT